jgi:hypothetical protein
VGIAELENYVSGAPWKKRTVEGEPRSRNMGIEGATKIDNDTSSEPHTTSPRKTGVDNAMAKTVSGHSVQFWAERNTKSDPHTAIGPHLQDSLSPLSAPATASPVVGLPFKSPLPSSESMIEVAIQNVARAGYLNIIPTAIKADQTPSQQGVNVTATHSKSKKRGQKDMEHGEDGGKPKKRAKIAVPAREQSLR